MLRRFFHRIGLIILLPIYYVLIFIAIPCKELRRAWKNLSITQSLKHELDGSFDGWYSDFKKGRMYRTKAEVEADRKAAYQRAMDDL